MNATLPLKLSTELMNKTRNPLIRCIEQQRRQSIYSGLFFLISIPVCMIWSLQTGAISIELHELLKQFLFTSMDNSSQLQWNVITQIRLPRLLMTFITGMGLAASGVIMQAICRNPLADPGLIGISSGATVFAALTFLLASSWALPTSFIQYILPIMAFTGAILVSVIIFNMAQTERGINTILLILAGVALNAIGGMLLGLLSYLSDDATLRLITFWTMGSYAGSGWSQLFIASFGIALALGAFWFLRLPLTLMLSGESEARHLGVKTTRVKTISLFAVAIATGCAVCFTGIVGFVGLVTPHICRLIVGPDVRRLLPVASLSGGLLVLMADAIARTIIIPAELPVGIITALLGAPFFIYLLMRQKKEMGHA
jgi:iron complex transport system permease protein